MAERVFATLGEYGFNLTTLTGADGSLGNLVAVGTQYLDSGTERRKLEYNYENKLMYDGVDHSNRRGMNVAVFDNNMSLTYMATFDLYGNVNAMDGFVNRIRSLKETEIAVLTTYDAIKSNDAVDALFKELRSVSWPTKSFFDKGTTYCRSSYAAFVCGKKMHIVAEKFVGGGTPEPNAVIDMSFSNPNTIGFSGYGAMLISDEETTSSVGVSPVVKTWIDMQSLQSLSLKIGDDLLFQGLGEINDIANSTDTFIEFELAYYDSTKTHITSTKKAVYSVEGWERVEIRDKIPFGCAYITVRANNAQKDGNAPSGSVYVKNIVMQTSDNAYAVTSNVSFGLYGTATKQYDDSLGNFGHYDPTGYYKAYYSDDNILRDLVIPQHTNEPIRWFDRVLDKPNERVVFGTTTSQNSSMPKVSIDPSKWYYACVWVNKQVKDGGSLGILFSAYDSSDTILEIKATDEKLTDTSLYAQNPPFDMLEDRQWYLMQGFILPSDVPIDKASEFIEKNKEFYGWDDLYGNGIGLSDEGDGYYGFINNANASKVEMILSDTDNTTESKTLWALPIIKELSIGSIDIDDGRLVSISLGS